MEGHFFQTKTIQKKTIFFQVGANWIRYKNESETNSFDGLVKATDLQFVDDDHQDVTFRSKNIFHLYALKTSWITQVYWIGRGINTNWAITFLLNQLNGQEGLIVCREGKKQKLKKWKTSKFSRNIWDIWKLKKIYYLFIYVILKCRA